MANLLVDIGHTALKASWADGMTLGRTFRYQGQHSIDFLISSVITERPDVMVLSSVRAVSDFDLKRLEKECGKLVLFGKDMFDEYEIPDYLTPDRAAYIIAARHLFKGKGCTIFDFGATMTVDFIDSDGKYEEGSISLGFRNRLKAFNRYVPELDASLKSSVSSGVISSIIFEIEGYSHKKNKNISIFTGGDAIYFAKRMKNCIFVVCNLVLIGLALIALEYDKKV